MYRLLLILLFLSIKTEAQKPAASSQLTLYFDQPEALKKADVKKVRCIFKDSRNLIWIGTDNGLFRYDGTNTIYQRHKAGDPTSIPNNTIASISEDREGTIWVGTMGGIAAVNPFSFKCKVYTHELHNLPEGNFDNKMLAGPSGEIWTGNSDGLYLLDKKQNGFKKVWRSLLPGKSVSGYVTSLLYWKPDTLVLGTFHDIVLIHTKNFGFRRIPLLKKDVLVGPMHIDRQHRLWIGTWGEGCLIGNSDLTQFQQYKWERDLPSGVDNIAGSFAETVSGKDHDMWIAGGWVLSKISLENKTGDVDLTKAFIYKTGTGKKNNDPENISCLLFDNRYVWTGGSAAVAKFSAEKNLFQITPVQINGVVENIQSIRLNDQNYLAISSWHGTRGISFWNRQNNSLKNINSIAPSDQYGANISGVVVDKLNRLWLASLAGTFLLNDQFQITGDLLKAANKKDIPSGKKTNDILISNDTVWLACYKNGIDLYDLNLRKLKHFINNDGSGLDEDLIQRIFRDRKGNIWICGNGYFYKFLPASSSFKKYDFSMEHSTYAPTDVTELPDGHLAIATATAGLIYFNPVSETFERISTSLLEKEESILSLTSDSEGNIWYLTSGHLVKYHPASRKFTLFGEEDGLDIKGLQLVRSFNGREIFLAEAERLIGFSPSDWERKAETPQVIMHSIRVNDSAIISDIPLTGLYLRYNQNRIYFEFDGVNYTKPEQNQYAYKLLGIDGDWIITNKNSVSYANIPPGNYEFRVRSANYSGEWSQEYAVKISIAPPFWRTWWFIGLSVLAIGGLFVMVIRYIAQRNLREQILTLEKEQAIEKERNRIAKDMHDDLGSGLTKIAILSEVAKAQLKEKEAAMVQLENISCSSRELVDNLQNIIWVLNPRNDSLENLMTYIREYALKFFEFTDVTVHFNYPQHMPALKLSEEQRRNIFMVVKETLNNTAKHSSCKNVFIGLHLQNRQLKIKIRDDGKGFEPSSVRPFANGLTNMKQRMEQVNGIYEIKSGTGKGATTTLAVSHHTFM